jgi:hypothetical protein
LNLDNNDIREAGLVALLKVLKENRSLAKLRLENNKFMISRQLLGSIGDVFLYHNRALRVLVMTSFGGGKSPLLRKEMDESGCDFDNGMIDTFMKEIQNKSNLLVLTI